MEPARNIYDDNEEEETPSRPSLRAIEGGGDTSEPASGHLHSVPTGGVYDADDKTPVTRPNLKVLEGGGQTSEKSSGHLSVAGAGSDKSKDEGEFGFRHEKGEAKPRGLRNKLRSLKNKAKNKWSVVVIGSLVMMTGIMIIFMFLGSLLIPNFVSSVVTYQFVRVTRETVSAASKIDAQKVALDAAPDNVWQRAKQRFNDNPKVKKVKEMWSKLDKYRPAKSVKNLEATQKLDYQYGEASKVLHRQRLIAVFVDGQRINIPQNTYGTFEKIFHPIKYLGDRINFRLELANALKGAMRDSNFLVRSKAGKIIRGKIKAKLFRYTPEEKEKLRNASKETQDVKNAQKSYEVATNNGTASTKAAQNAKSDGVKKAATEAAEEMNACYKDDKCTAETLKRGGGLSEKALAAIESTVGESAFNAVLNKVSSFYAVGVPICLILDGSAQNSQDTIETNSDEAQRTFVSVSSMADEQKTGDAIGEEIGPMTRQLGQTGRSIPQMRASGVPVDTTKSFAPQAPAGGSYEYDILDVLLPSLAADAISPILDKACPLVTNPAIGALLAGLNVIPGVGAALKAAEIPTTRIVARAVATSVGNVIRNMFAKKSLKQITRTTVATVGATLLARLLVMQHMGAINDGTARGQSFAEQVDMGGNMFAQDLDRVQNYGAPLTNEALARLKPIDDAARKEYFASQSFYDRYLAVTNPGSFMNRLAVTANAYLNLESFSSMLTSVPRLLNPVNLLTKLGTVFHPFAKVSAAAEVDKENYNIVQWGWSPEEEDAFLNDPKYEMLANQEALDQSGKQDEIHDKYDKCFQSTVGQLLAQGDIIRDENGNIVEDEGDCAPRNLGMRNPNYGDLVYRWRVAMRYSLVLDERINQQEITK